jgi:RNA polymerase sigma-70 factor (ECF subfamily)
VPRAPDTRGLAEALRAGDASAFDLLLERHGTALLGYAQGWLQPADAENAMQDAWLELVQKRARIPADDSALRPFLFGFVRNHVRRCLQSRLTFEPLPPDIADDGDADLVILARERRELLLQAMLALDPLQQDVILATLDGNRPGAIADQLDLAAGHVRVLKHRALAILRARLGGA